MCQEPAQPIMNDYFQFHLNPNTLLALLGFQVPSLNSGYTVTRYK